MASGREPVTVVLERYTGSWHDDDPDANFKREVAEYTRADPLETLNTLSANTAIPVGVLARYVLVKWAAEGSEALLALGPGLVGRMWRVVADAEEAGTDRARLAAYDTLHQMISWLRQPLTETSSDRTLDADGSTQPP
jgi:hypothetical protein